MIMTKRLIVSLSWEVEIEDFGSGKGDVCRVLISAGSRLKNWLLGGLSHLLSGEIG